MNNNSNNNTPTDHSNRNYITNSENNHNNCHNDNHININSQEERKNNSHSTNNQSRLQQIKQFGQKIWLDNLSRELYLSGQLANLIAHDGIAGITSNPSIFFKAISTDKHYQEDAKSLKLNGSLSAEERYEQLVLPDIIACCDIFMPLYSSTHHEDGYVSFEVSPHIAHNAQATIDNAKRLWQLIKRPNLMIKVPATQAGLEAFTALTADGINVNITLIFSLEQLLAVWQAYFKGLQIRLNKGLSINSIKAVASFFLSRIDSALDHKLPQNLQGKTAINIVKLAYLHYQEIFLGPNFMPFAKAQAMPQYLLFASTGTKNPQYSDTLYVSELIGKHTINTAPDSTLDAFRDHGIASESLPKGINDAATLIEQISQYVDLTQLGNQLQVDGLKIFNDSFDSLLQLLRD